MTLRPRLAALLGILMLVLLIAQWPLALAARSGAYSLLDPIIDVHHVLTNDYVVPIDAQAMQAPMLEAMIGTLNDPYTVYVPPAQARDFDKELRGKYVGIGAEVSHENGIFRIITPMPGSPALKAGIMAGDIILEIDHAPIEGKTTEQCIDLLLGEAGTTVNLRVRRNDDTETVLPVIRRQIVTQTVGGLTRHGEGWNYCLDQQAGMYYVTINQFNETTAAELREALESIGIDRVHALVLDLRENPGGALTAAIDVADLFLSQGQIVSVRDRKNDERSWRAHRPRTLPDFPMVVLANRFSASAAEIVAGALQENDRARVLGMRTFGKGSVQEVRELGPDRGTLKFTAARYMLPSGRNISRTDQSTTWGVDPDPGFVVATSEDEDRDRINAHRAFQVIRNGDGHAPVCAEPQWIQSTLKDRQLALAIRALHARLNSGQWESVGADVSELAALEDERQRLTTRRDFFIEQVESLNKRLESLTLDSDSQEDADATARMEDQAIPETSRVAEGEVILRDATGAEIGRYSITGDIVAALNSLQLRPLAASDR